MENLLKTELGYTTLKQIGSGGGCINKGVAYETNEGKIYVKYNTNTDVSYWNTEMLIIYTNLFYVYYFEWKEVKGIKV